MSKATKVDPYARARELLEKQAIKSFPVPVEKIAKALGAQIRFAPLDDELSGMVYVKEGVPIIGVNSLHHPNRQRFTIAHEIAHMELHLEMITTSVHVDKKFIGLMRDSNSSTGSEEIEIEANQFASELLMPQKLLEAELEGKQIDIDDDGPIEELAKKFRVSKQALLYRIGNRGHKE
jgi:Zn-dependent peptidase ImmA (M78 family)